MQKFYSIRISAVKDGGWLVQIYKRVSIYTIKPVGEEKVFNTRKEAILYGAGRCQNA